MTEKTLREEMEAAFDEIEARQDGVDDAEGISDEAEIEDQPDVSPDVEDGAESDGTEAEPDDDQETVEAPEHWSVAERERFQSIADPEARKMLIDVRQSLERGYNSKFEEVAEVSRQAREWDRLFQPYDNALQMNGLSRGQYVQSLMAAEQMLRTNPREGFAHLARQYGIDLAELASPQEEVDPHIARLTHEIQSLKQAQEQARTAESQQRQSTMAEQIAAFREATDENGKKRHPHFEAVYQDMVNLARPGATLDDLYEQAVWSNPATRKVMLSEQEKADKARRTAEQKAKAEKARKASTPSSRGGGVEAVKGETPRQTMERVYREMADQ